MNGCLSEFALDDRAVHGARRPGGDRPSEGCLSCRARIDAAAGAGEPNFKRRWRRRPGRGSGPRRASRATLARALPWPRSRRRPRRCSCSSAPRRPPPRVGPHGEGELARRDRLPAWRANVRDRVGRRGRARRPPSFSTAAALAAGSVHPGGERRWNGRLLAILSGGRRRQRHVAGPRRAAGRKHPAR